MPDQHPVTDNRPLYVDHNATTAVDTRVFTALAPYLTGEWGNPSSSHPYGRRWTTEAEVDAVAAAIAHAARTLRAA